MKLEEIYEIMHKKGLLLAHLSDPDAEAYLVAAQFIKLSIDKPALNNRCPNCRRQLRKPIAPHTVMSGRKISRQGDNFCPRCGQKIKWEV